MCLMVSGRDSLGHLILDLGLIIAEGDQKVLDGSSSRVWNIINSSSPQNDIVLLVVT